MLCLRPCFTLSSFSVAGVLITTLLVFFQQKVSKSSTLMTLLLFSISKFFNLTIVDSNCILQLFVLKKMRQNLVLMISFFCLSLICPISMPLWTISSNLKTHMVTLSVGYFNEVLNTFTTGIIAKNILKFCYKFLACH